MKPIVVFLLLAAPLLALSLDLAPVVSLNTTEKTVVKSETNLESLHSPVTTDASNGKEIKDNALHANAKTEKLDPASLHRVPLYENRHPLVESISNLESLAKNADQKKSEEKANASTSTQSPEIELPIPSRCPAITGYEEEHSKDAMIPLLGIPSKPRAAQRGCRFFIMSELMDRAIPQFMHATAEEQLNRTLQSCFTSCIQAYDNGTDVCAACQDGCRKTAQVTEAAKKALSAHEGDELEREDEDGHGADMHRSFSIIIPLRPLDQADESKDGAAAPGSDPFPSMMPNAIKMMLSMMHQMSERARQAMIRGQDGATNVGSNVQESEMSISQDPSSNAISVSRSMSVLMTKDKDGHSKMVVVHTLPKIQIHRFGQSLFGSDDDDVARRFHELTDGKDHLALPSNGDDNDDDLMEDGDDFRVRLFGHLSNGHRSGSSSHQKTDGHSLHEEEGTTQVYYYRTRLCYLLPRLFYITLAILALYLLFWICCAVPTALASRASARRGSSESAIAIMATTQDGKRKKLFLSKNARYFQLNNKRNSTTSLPPPYPGSEHGDSCAEALPEKQPIPEGGIEVKLASDK